MSRLAGGVDAGRRQAIFGPMMAMIVSGAALFAYLHTRLRMRIIGVVKIHTVHHERMWPSGRATASQAVDRGFESRHPLHLFSLQRSSCRFFYLARSHS